MKKAIRCNLKKAWNNLTMLLNNKVSLIFGSIFGFSLTLYFAIYQVADSKHSQSLNIYNSQFSNFTSLLTSGNKHHIKNAFLLSSALCDITIISEPILLKPQSWFSKSRNETNVVRKILINCLEDCTKSTCGSEKYRIDLSDIELSKVELDYANFTDVNLRNVTLNHTNFINPNFDFSNLDFLTLKNSSIRVRYYVGKKYEDTLNDVHKKDILILASMHPNFQSTSMQGVKINNTEILGAVFFEAKFNSAMGLLNTVIERSKIIDCYFFNCNMDGLKIKDSDIRGSDFRRTILDNVEFENVLYDEFTKFPNDFNVKNRGLIYRKSKS